MNRNCDLWTIILFISLPLVTSCSLLNSGTVSIKYNEVRATIDGRKYENKRNLSSVSLSVRNVQHPSFYGDWNFNIRITPSIHFDRTTFVTDELRTDPDTGEQSRFPDIKTQRFSTLANLKFITHTPIGAFALTGGAGIAGYYVRDGEALNSYRTNAIFKTEIVYVGFITKHLFLLFGPRVYYDKNRHLSIAFRIGYHWGKTK